MTTTTKYTAADRLEKLIGYDTSADEHHLSVLCVDCGSAGDGTPIYAGEEWGAPGDALDRAWA